MLNRTFLVACCLLNLTGCVAAIPLVSQAVTGANTASRLCDMAILPGQTTSVCDRLTTAAAQPPARPATVR